MCVCVCVCMCACACMCVHVCGLKYLLCTYPTHARHVVTNGFHIVVILVPSEKTKRKLAPVKVGTVCSAI